MASKRNSRVFLVDEAKLRCGAKDDPLSLAPEMEEGQRTRTIPREASATSRSRSTSSGGRETKGAGTCSNRMADTIATAPPKVSITTRSVDYPTAPIDGRPVNFGVVVPGVYRSSYPKPDDYGFLQGLKLKTVVTLVKKDELDHNLQSFTRSNGIRQVIFNMKGTKKEAIPVATMASILRLVLDTQNYPLLVHCNHGKHRTGCVVAVVRKLSGWDLNNVLDEYKTYAAPKIRECDVDYISGFQSPSLQSLLCEPARLSPVQVKTFFRTLLFSTFVMVLWLLSGSRLAPAPRDLAA